MTLPPQDQVSNRSAGEGTCLNARTQGSNEATRRSPREEPQGGREGPFCQETKGGWTVLSSNRHETSLRKVVSYLPDGAWKPVVRAHIRP